MEPREQQEWVMLRDILYGPAGRAFSYPSSDFVRLQIRRFNELSPKWRKYEQAIRDRINQPKGFSIKINEGENQCGKIALLYTKNP